MLVSSGGKKFARDPLNVPEIYFQAQAYPSFRLGIGFLCKAISSHPTSALLMWLPRQHIKKQRHYFTNKGLSSQGYGFSSGHVWI